MLRSEIFTKFKQDCLNNGRLERRPEGKKKGPSFDGPLF